MKKEPTRIRRTFTPEFKRDAVHLVTAEGRSVNEVAMNLGIARSLLQHWMRRNSSKQTEPFPGKGKLGPEAQRVRELEQKLRRTEMERDILKKALAYFADEQK